MDKNNTRILRGFTSSFEVNDCQTAFASTPPLAKRIAAHTKGMSQYKPKPTFPILNRRLKSVETSIPNAHIIKTES